MEGSIKTRVLAVGVALLFTIGGGTLVTGSTAAAAQPGSRTPEHGESAAATSQVLAAGVSTRRHRKHKARHRARQTQAARVTARWSGSVNTSSPAAVNAAYQSQYAAGLDVPTGYEGDVGSCEAGGTTVESRTATLRAINFVRSLGGLAPVGFSETLNARSQYTALMMAANQTLSHSPSSSWRCYTATGASNAARANLALAYPSITSAGVVGMYMKELGSSNYAVGHRRWLMNPFSTAMGSGATDNANAITVIGPSSWYRPNPAYVAWPTAGWFPNTLEPNGRWSLSAGNRKANFSRATVRVYRNGVAVPTVKNRVANGYAQPTLVWEMPDSVAKSGTFRVVVSGIRMGKKKRASTYAYTVGMFTPTN